MKLLTNQIKDQLPKLYSQDNVEDPIVYIKFFDPTSQWTWYVIEGEQEEEDFRFFGLVIGFEAELGYFSLNELLHCKDNASGLKSLPIERDLYFKPQKLSECK